MAASRPVQKTPLLVVLGALAFLGCVIISAAVAFSGEGSEKPFAVEGVNSHQVCICSPKLKGNDQSAPDCKCTDLSILDKLLFPEETPSRAATNPAYDDTETRSSAVTNASQGFDNNGTEPTARLLHYKSARAVFFEHFSPAEHSDSSLSETTSATCIDGLSSEETSTEPSSLERTLVADGKTSPLKQALQTLGKQGRDFCRAYLGNTPWSVALLSVVSTLTVTWGMNKLLARGGLCRDLKPSG